MSATTDYVLKRITAQSRAVYGKHQGELSKAQQAELTKWARAEFQEASWVQGFYPDTLTAARITRLVKGQR